MRALDLFQSFPLLYPGARYRCLDGSASSVIIRSCLLVPQFIRLVRGKSHRLTKMRFYEAAIAMGSSRARLIFVQLLPNLQDCSRPSSHSP